MKFFVTAFISIVVIPSAVFSEIIADQFKYPVDPWEPGCNGYWSVCNKPDSWHLGVDISANTGTEVYSIANGVVKHVDLHSGYGYVVIIEHVLPNGDKVCSLYGHLKSNVPVSSGEDVYPGKLVGYLGTTEENGGWEPHLHIAIKKGQFDLSGYNYNCNGILMWGYSGYTKCLDQKDTWYDPLEFIAQHQSIQVLPGQLPSGEINQRILDCYNQFSSLVGEPYDNGGGLYVHEWYSQNGQFLVTIQDFRNQNNEYFAIIDNPDLGRAFLLQGGFRWYCTTQVDGPAYFGAPTSNELVWQYYPLVNGVYDTTKPMVMYKRQEFESGAYLLWQFGTTDVIPVEGTGGGDFSIATLPRNGTSMEIFASARSDTELYVTISSVASAVRYDLYFDGAKIGEIADSKVIGGLQPNSTYTIVVKAIDANGNVVTSAQVAATTKQTSTEWTGPVLPFEYWVHSSQVEIGVPSYSGATSAEVIIDGVSYNAMPGAFFLSPNLTNGTKTLQIKLYNSSGVKVAQTLVVEFTIGQVATSTSAGPAEVGPNYSGQIIFRFTAKEAATIDKYMRVDWATSPWTAPAISTYPAFSVSANETKEIVVPFTTGSQPSTNGTEAIALYGQGKTASGQTVFFQKVHVMKTAPFNDALLEIADSNLQGVAGQNQYITLTMESQCNSSQPPLTVELRVDGILVASVMSPQLKARERWTATLPIRFLSQGTHQVEVFVDPENSLSESDENNNRDVAEFIVTSPPTPDLKVTGLQAQVSAGMVTVSFSVENIGSATAGSSFAIVGVGGQSREASVATLASSQADFLLEEFAVSQTGAVVIVAVADPDNLIAETDESNNLAEAALNIAPPLPPPTINDVYQDSLVSGWSNGSWSVTVNQQATEFVASGASSLSATFKDTPWGGLKFHNYCYQTDSVDALSFKINGGAVGYQRLQLILVSKSGAYLKWVRINDYVDDYDLLPNTWYDITIPLSDLNAGAADISDIVIQAFSGKIEPTFYLDEVRFELMPE